MVFITMGLMGVSVAGGFALSMSQKGMADARMAAHAPRAELITMRVENARPEAVRAGVVADVLMPLPSEVERLHTDMETQTVALTGSRVIDNSAPLDDAGGADVTRASLDLGSVVTAPEGQTTAPRARVVVPSGDAATPLWAGAGESPLSPGVAPTVSPSGAPVVTLRRAAPAIEYAPARPRVQIGQVHRSPRQSARFPNTLIGVYR